MIIVLILIIFMVILAILIIISWMVQCYLGPQRQFDHHDHDHFRSVEACGSILLFPTSNPWLFFSEGGSLPCMMVSLVTHM